MNSSNRIFLMIIRTDSEMARFSRLCDLSVFVIEFHVVIYFFCHFFQENQFRVVLFKLWIGRPLSVCPVGDATADCILHGGSPNHALLIQWWLWCECNCLGPCFQPVTWQDVSFKFWFCPSCCPSCPPAAATAAAAAPVVSIAAADSDAEAWKHHALVDCWCLWTIVLLHCYLDSIVVLLSLLRYNTQIHPSMSSSFIALMWFYHPNIHLLNCELYYGAARCCPVLLSGAGCLASSNFTRVSIFFNDPICA